MQAVFEILLLAAHLACMNVAAGGPLVAVWLEWKDRRGDSVAGEAARYLVGCAIVALLIGSLLGAAIGWLRWTPEYESIWRVQLARPVYFGLWELGFSAALVIAYYVWRSRAELATRFGFIGRSVLLLLASTNLLYHFPPLLTIATKLADGALDTELVDATQPIRSLGRLKLLDDVPALTTHFALASVALAGLMLLGLALKRMKQDLEIRNAKRIATWGGWAALGATSLQLVVGLWLLATTPPNLQSQLLGSSLAPTICFGISIVCAVWLLRELAEIALGEPTRGAIIRVMIAMTLVVTLMTAARQLSRPSNATPSLHTLSALRV